MNTIFCKTRDEWREWLDKNHTAASEIWLVYMKKHTKKQSVSYTEAVEEALCFGWIDSLVKSIDSNSYMQKYTPRKKNSVWSLVNKKRVEKMIAENKMTNAGMEMVEIAKKNGWWEKAYSSKQSFTVPEEFLQALNDNPKAGAFFKKLSPSHQNQYIGYIVTAKRADTRLNRVARVIDLLEKGIKAAML